MSRELDDFLSQVRDADGPSDGDVRRVLSRVNTAVAVGAVSATAASVAASMSTHGVAGQIGVGTVTSANVGSAGTSASGAGLGSAGLKAGVVAKVGSSWGVGAMFGSKITLLSFCAAAVVGVGLSVALVKEEKAGSDSAMPVGGGAIASSASGLGDNTPTDPGADTDSDSDEAVELDVSPLPATEPHSPTHAPPGKLVPTASPREELDGKSTDLRQEEHQRAPRSSKSSGAQSLRAELESLQRVQSALRRGDGDAALRELDEHSSADPRLAAERQVARILALCASGRISKAKQLAARFVRSHPESLHARAIANSCAESVTD